VAPRRIAGIGAQPDVIYERFLSSHLPEPEQAVAGLANELAAGGLLLVEEVDGRGVRILVKNTQTHNSAKIASAGVEIGSKWLEFFLFTVNKTKMLCVQFH
jgi:hypothetical protein